MSCAFGPWCSALAIWFAGATAAGDPGSAEPAVAPPPPSSSPVEPEPTSQGSTPPSGVPVESTPAPEPHDTESLPASDVTADVPVALDVVLGCGLRLVAAQDDTLPVAAVVLALDVGTADDPPELPGLVHALAYHLLEGNRELAPGASLRAVHDAGGVAHLATSAGQVRFESLVPLPLLSEVLRIESVRLRAPTLHPERWEKALTWASRDTRPPSPLPVEVLAEVHGSPGLAHDGRIVSQELLRLPMDRLGPLLAERFRYERATLVVVAPQSPVATLATVQGWFADLPASTRIRPEPLGAPAPGAAGLRELEVPAANGSTFVWPLAPDPAVLHVARVGCRTLNRMRPPADEGKSSVVRCMLLPDPRFPTLVVKVEGKNDPEVTLRSRLQQLHDAEQPLLDRQRKLVARDLERELDRPLPLARQLATHLPPSPAPTSDGAGMRPLALLTGAAALLPEVWRAEPLLAEVFDPARATRLVPPPDPPGESATP